MYPILFVDFFRWEPAMFAWSFQSAQVFGIARAAAALIGFLSLRHKPLRFA
jgi:hypothetical protein